MIIPIVNFIENLDLSKLNSPNNNSLFFQQKKKRKPKKRKPLFRMGHAVV